MAGSIFSDGGSELEQTSESSGGLVKTPRVADFVGPEWTGN